MNTTIRALAAGLLALTMGVALADGVPLITAGPPIMANDAVRQNSTLATQSKHPAFVKLHSIELNKAAFGANVLTVMVDGKEYRFVGTMQAPLPPHDPAVKRERQPSESWVGREPGGGLLVLYKDANGLIGQLELPPARRFQIISPPGRTVMIEKDANVYVPLNYAPTAKALAAAASAPASGSQR